MCDLHFIALSTPASVVCPGEHFDAFLFRRDLVHHFLQERLRGAGNDRNADAKVLLAALWGGEINKEGIRSSASR